MGKSILVVDDDEDIRNYMKTILGKNGYSVSTAKDGSEGIYEVEMQPVDLILSDVKMPEMDGLQFNKWCISHGEAPVLLMTGFDNILETKEAHDIGLNHFITKPINEKELIETIESVLQHHGFGHIKEKAPEEVKESAPVSSPEAIVYHPITIEEFVMGVDIKYPIYLQLSPDKYIKIAHEASSLDIDRLEKFKSKQIDSLYMTEEDYQKYMNEFKDKKGNIDGKADQNIRSNILNASKNVVESVYLHGMDKAKFEEANKFFMNSLDEVSNDSEVVKLLDVFNSLDNKYYAHLISVSMYGLMLARKMKWHTEHTLFLISIGGMFHDAGKKDMPEDLLLKRPEDMNETELSQYRDHPIHGTEVLNSFHKFAPQVLQIAIQHHEKIDGTGFPFGLKRQEIYPISKLVHLIDLFANYVVDDGIHKPLTPMEACSLIEKEHIEGIDPLLFQALKKMVA